MKSKMFFLFPLILLLANISPSSAIFNKSEKQLYKIRGLDSNASTLNWRPQIVIHSNDIQNKSGTAYPRVSVNQSDQVFISWRDNVEFLMTTYLRRSDDRGVSFGPDSLVSASHTPWEHALVTNGNNVYVIWGYNYVTMTHSIDYGDHFNQEIRVDHHPDGISGGSTNSGHNPEMVRDSYGYLYAVWAGGLWGNNHVNYGIYFAKSIDGGEIFGDIVRVDDFPGTQLQQVLYPTIAVSPNGVIYVTWMAYTVGSWNYDVYFTRSTDGGHSFEPSRRINDIPLINSSPHPQIAIYQNYFVYIVWSDNRNGNADIYFARSLDGGLTFKPNQKINNDTGSNEQTRPSISSGPNGQIILSWTDYSKTTLSNANIYSAISFDNGITFSENVRVNQKIGDLGFQYRSYTTFDNQGIAHIVWECYEGVCYSSTLDLIYTISGRISDTNGQPVQGIPVYATEWLSGTTNINGNYVINVKPGTYTVIPRGWYEFTPSKLSVTIDKQNIADINFIRGDQELCHAENVPLYLQGDPSTPASLPNHPPWWDDTYDNYELGDKENTIGKWGCNTTSHAMLLRYLGLANDLSLSTDPRSLNYWLAYNKGYNSEHGLIYSRVALYGRKQGLHIFLEKIAGQDDALLTDHLCRGMPVVLDVGGHYVLATGRAIIDDEETFAINDPVWGVTTLKEHYNEYLSAYYYKVFSKGDAILTIYALSPIHLIVTDPSGRKAGFDPNSSTTWNEIPNTEYLQEKITAPNGDVTGETKILSIVSPQTGSYKIETIGYDTGPYTVLVDKISTFGDISDESFSGQAQAGSMNEYETYFSKAYTISGRILDNNNNPLTNVIVSTHTSISSTTDTNGNYIIPDLITNTYTITPEKSNYTFAPSSIDVGVPPNKTNVNFTGTLIIPPKETILYFSFNSNGVIDDLVFSPEDVLSYDTLTKKWSIFFDGSDVGLNKVNVDAFSLNSDSSILLSTNKNYIYRPPKKSPKIKFTGSDIIKFIPSSLGEDTAGTFTYYFDGSDVQLASSGENIDTIGFTQEGNLVISTSGTSKVKGYQYKIIRGKPKLLRLQGDDADLLMFTPRSLGSKTSGKWDMYFDGSNAGLIHTINDITSMWIDPIDGNLYLSSAGEFSIGDISGDGSDIYVCTPVTLGSNAKCEFGPLYWDGSEHGLSGYNIDGFAFVNR